MKKNNLLQVFPLIGIFLFIFVAFQFSQNTMENVGASSSTTPEYLLEVPRDPIIGDWLDIDTDSQGNYYALNRLNYRITVYSADKNFLDEWDTRASDFVSGSKVYGMEIDKYQNLVIVDLTRELIEKYSLEGEFLSSFGVRDVSDPLEVSSGGRDIAMDTANNYFVIDIVNKYIKKFDSNGNLITKWMGSWGVNASLTNIYIDELYDTNPANDLVYVTDANHRLIDIFDINGNALGTFSILTLPPSIYDASMVRDSLGNSYVVSNGYSRIQKFDSSYNLTNEYLIDQASNVTGAMNMDNSSSLMIPVATRSIEFYNLSGTFLEKFGAVFSRPTNLAIRNAEILVSNTNIQNYQKHIRKYSAEGLGFEQIIPFGPNPGDLQNPTGMIFDNNGRFIVADGYTSQIKIYNSDFSYISSFGSNGIGDGQFGYVIGGVEVDENNNIYVIDSSNSRIQRFEQNGDFLSSFGSGGPGDGQFAFTSNSNVSIHKDYIYVTDSNNYRVQKFTLDGDFVSKWGSKGSAEGQFPDNPAPSGIDFDSQSNCYVLGGDMIHVFDSEGNFIYRFGEMGYGEGELKLSIDLKIDDFDNIYIADYLNNRIQIYGNPNSRFLDSEENPLFSGEVVDINEGGDFTYNYSLSSPIDYNVIITFEQNTAYLSIFNKLIGMVNASSPQADFTPSSLTFTPDNWSTPQQVTIHIVDDNDYSGDYDLSISHVASSETTYYNGTFGTLSFAVADNDSLSPTGRNVLIGLVVGVIALGGVVIAKKRIIVK